MDGEIERCGMVPVAGPLKSGEEKVMNVGNVALEEMKNVCVAMCRLGPLEAEELLKRNTHNRKMSDSVVDKYVREMKLGEWLPIAAGIGFDTAGTLTDGQNRLEAIRRFGGYVPMLVVTNLPITSQAKQDRQRKRTLADVFMLDGTCQDKLVVQTATFLARLLVSGDTVPADAEVKATILAHRDSMSVICGILNKHNKGIAQVGVRAAMTLAHEKHGAKACDFLKSVLKENHACADDPAFRLRKVLLGDSRSVQMPGFGAGQQMWSFRKTIFAFNCFLRGEKISAVYEAREIVD